MPSLFSRKSVGRNDKRPSPVGAHTAPSRSVPESWSQPEISEFGAVDSRQLPPTHPLTPPRSVSPPGTPTPPLLPPKFVFLSTKLPPSAPTVNSVDSFAYGSDEHTAKRDYGFLQSVGKDVVLGLDEVARVIREVSAELGSRGLETPLLFSNQALELNHTRTRSLILAYLSTVTQHSRVPLRSKLETFKEDLSYARDYDLAWLLRWALSRMTRVREGTRELCHGCIEWDVYEEWRGRERSANYPSDAFPFLSTLLPSDVHYHVIVPLFALLTRFAAHSHASGLTPHALSSLFAPLLFDVPASSTCMVAHSAFVRAAYATEHLILSHIRSSGRRDGVGVSDLPSRLQGWVKGYPAMVASDAELARGRPRKGARVVRCEVAAKTVRAYSRDLVATSETWAAELPGRWDAWERVAAAPATRRGEPARPKFSAAWRRRMLVKETLPLSVSVGHQETVYGLAAMPNDASARPKPSRPPKEEDGFEGRWSSLAGKDWSAFEEGGFDAPALSLNLAQPRDIRSKLQFDLNESAKSHILSERRQTVNWQDFAADDGGFSRTDPFLTASLTFSAPVSTSITEWPREREELRRRLHKSQKEATPFAYDTTPHVGAQADIDGVDTKGRVWIEEAFVDCWADLMMGAGWDDRDELTFKEANWAVIEYKARPARLEEDAPHPRDDPRTTELYILFEERVPLEYQMAVADPKRKTTLATLFTLRKKRQPLAPLDQRDDFDRMLLTRSQPRKLALTGRSDNLSASVWHRAPEPSPRHSATPSPTKDAASQPRPIRARTKSGGDKRDRRESTDGSGDRSRFSKSVRRVKSTTDQRDKARAQRECEVDFEVHSASGLSSGGNSPGDGKVKSADDKWMDILIAHGARRMDRQDAAIRPNASRDKPPAPLPVSPPLKARRPDQPAHSLPSPPVAALSARLSTPPELHAVAGTAPARSSGRPVQNPQEVAASRPLPAPPAEVHLETPQPRRDTVTSVFDHYRYSGVSDLSIQTATTSSSDYGGQAQVRNLGSAEKLEGGEATDGDGARDTDPARDSLGDVPEDGTPRADGHGDEGTGHLTPPGPIFDLTPGREPSPARYKHGEPLQFVGEEPEEEEY
ncbi:hypothetical protein Q5752_000528 [Cryptotrichosporon argae]